MWMPRTRWLFGRLELQGDGWTDEVVFWPLGSGRLSSEVWAIELGCLLDPAYNFRCVVCNSSSAHMETLVLLFGSNIVCCEVKCSQ